MPNKAHCVTPMVEEVTKTAQLMGAINASSFQKEMVLKSLEGIDLSKIKRVMLSGCGDSYASGVSAKEGFEALTGLPCEAPASVELSRYTYPDLFENSLVILNSISGGVARVVEGCLRAKKYGAATLALTGSATSKIAELSDSALIMNDLPKRSPEISSPKVLAYTASCAGLLHLAIAIGEKIGHINAAQADGYRKDLLAYSTEAFGAAMERMDDDSFEAAKSWSDKKSYVFLGDGSEYGAAIFGAFKWPESMGRMAAWDDTENWNHVNYFQKDIPSVGTAVVVRKDSPSMSRVFETVEALCTLGRNVVVVTDDQTSDFPKGALICRIPEAPHSWMAPCFLHLPLALFAAYVHGIEKPSFVPYRNKGELWTDPGAAHLTQSKIVEL